MIIPRRTSVVVLITLAELAWLAGLGLLFAYRSKVGELGRVQHELHVAQSDIATLRTSAPNLAALLDKLKAANSNNLDLKQRLDLFTKELNGVSPEEAARRLAAGDKAADAQAELERKLQQQEDDLKKLKGELESTNNDLAASKKLCSDLSLQLADLQKQLAKVILGATNLADRLSESEREKHQWVEGEFAVRRELTGLPDDKLQRVIFLVDTSTSMRESPFWDSTKQFIKTWLQFLPVEECALVNFNDKATGYPKGGYFRVRDSDGRELPTQRDDFLKYFDEVGSGTFTDLMKGLKLAYRYPPADVMVLFTDGLPHVNYQGDASFARDILAEVAKHRGPPILAVALGGYEVENEGGFFPHTNSAIAFLKELGHSTGGSFIAR